MNPNDPAFPTDSTFGVLTKDNVIVTRPFHIPGLTKREYFAAMAMQGEIYGLSRRATSGEDYVKSMPMIAELAVGWADALIAELSK